jgi:hypothetical protein
VHEQCVLTSAVCRQWSNLRRAHCWWRCWRRQWGTTCNLHTLSLIVSLCLHLSPLSLCSLSLSLVSSLSASLSVSLCVSLSLSLYLYLSLSLSLSIPPSLSLPLCLSLLSQSLSLSLSLSLSVCVSPSASLPLSLSVSLSRFLSLSRSLARSLCLFLSLTLCLFGIRFWKTFLEPSQKRPRKGLRHQRGGQRRRGKGVRGHTRGVGRVAQLLQLWDRSATEEKEHVCLRKMKRKCGAQEHV